MTSPTGTHKTGLFGTTGVDHDYDLSIEVDCPPGECVDDEWEDNDSQTTPSLVFGTDIIDTEICAEGDDWYNLPLKATCKLGMKIMPQHRRHRHHRRSLQWQLTSWLVRRGPQRHLHRVLAPNHRRHTAAPAWLTSPPAVTTAPTAPSPMPQVQRSAR
ncbi:MAG: hypothetical protein ACJATT_001243 [Myxococcota bacterium]|jgi:hypothetical protein